MKAGKWYKPLCIIIFALVLWWGYLMIKIYYYSIVDDVKNAGAIVVLGASQWNGQPSPVFQARLDRAYDLYEKGVSRKIILTGGIGKGESISEAKAGKLYLLERGTQEEDILMEEIGKTSRQSLDQVKLILKENNLSTIILVSDSFHMMRLKKMAGDLNIETYVSPVKDGPVNKNKLTQLRYYFREGWVYILYLAFGL